MSDDAAAQITELRRVSYREMSTCSEISIVTLNKQALTRQSKGLHTMCILICTTDLSSAQQREQRARQDLKKLHLLSRLAVAILTTIRAVPSSVSAIGVWLMQDEAHRQNAQDNASYELLLCTVCSEKQ
jgi:hypothetical protein